MNKSLICAVLLATTAFGQYKVEPAGPPPSDLAPAVKEAVQKDGAKVVASNGSVFCEIWLRATAPAGAKSTEQAVSLPTIPHGAMLGVIRFPNQGSERRGSAIQPGLYTLRYSYYPPDGNHQGVSPQRDFLLIVPAASDTDVNSTPSYKELVTMSSKATGTPHPGVLSVWKDTDGHAPGLTQEGEDWVLHAKIGDTPVAIIVVGMFAG